MHGAKRLIKGAIPASWWLMLIITFVRVRYALMFFHFRGREVECPLCVHSFKRFLPDRIDIPVLRERHVVGGGFEFATCPRCHSTYRERLVYLFVRDRTHLLKAPSKVLHVAPERNLRKVLSCRPNLDYRTADLDSPLAAIKMDVTDIRCPDDEFDVIICNHVLEHVADDARAMSELFRVLKPGGFAILQVPIALSEERTDEDPGVLDPAEREARFGQYDHVRLYGRDYPLRLERAGFHIEQFQAVQEFGEPLTRKYGLQPEETLYVCSKRKASYSSR